MTDSLWQKCLDKLQNELTPQQFNTWIRPLHVLETDSGLRLLAPNRFVLDRIKDKFIDHIDVALNAVCTEQPPQISLEIGSRDTSARQTSNSELQQTQPISKNDDVMPTSPPQRDELKKSIFRRRGDVQKNDVCVVSNLNDEFTLTQFVEGKSNQLARAASIQVGENPGKAYNPLFIYGGVGLGKTHLMHAIGHMIIQNKPSAKVIYLHSERFVGDMVKALQHNAINEFKRIYRSVDALLIDDIQFFAGKERSQEEFFHTFNSLLEGQQQIIMTCDRYPKEIEGLEERLKSRFGWGLTVCIEPPELETRVAILMAKAAQAQVELSNEVAFFIAKRIRSNVRELEGALKRVIANSRFTQRPITMDFTREALKDLLALQEKLVTIENIQRTVSEYYSVSLKDLLSKRRTRSVARPRQMAMALAKELTNHSLPEIGDAFGGRDHTTVLHACGKINELKTSDNRIVEDFNNLLRTLTS